MQAGTRLGRYTIVSPLGAGGMGEVYRARDERLGREVAVKVLPDELSRDEAALGRFRREARVLAGLSHPNLLAIFDVGEQDGVAYAVLELLEGETLRERLRRGPLGEEATRIGAGIARGLAAAHARGVVHRDLKPENVFLDAEGRVKVLDFGLAKEVVGDDPADLQESTELLLTQANTVLGTPGYMAPEQVRGEAATPRTDVFALGCILHEMISGRSPFRRPTLVSTLSAVLHEEPPEIDSSPGLPSRLVRLIRRCLAKAPEDRPASAAEVADELHGVVGPRSGTARRLGRWRPSRRALAAAAAVILLSALALLATRGWPAPGDGRQGAAPSGAAAVASLAVLPLTDRTAPEGAEEAYFAEGIAEAWIQRLSRLPDLKVISRASTLRYRGAARDPLAAGEALGVEALLLGEIVPLGEEVRLGAELVAAGDGARLWGAAVTGSPADLLTLQETLVDGLVASLGREVPDAALPEAARAHDPQAHRLYLQGRHHWSKRDAESLRQAIALFDEAIAADPQFALAYAGLADVYSILHDFADIPAAETFPRAAAAARRAIQLAPDLAEAHNSLAYVDHYWQRDFAAAEAGYRRA
ncbi:MAG TPA: protein kinase, partial [Thermoanaerobaculia bacterium]|nr:protein kinase [Thermoanaerobaculia bacterium]